MQIQNKNSEFKQLTSPIQIQNNNIIIGDRNQRATTPPPLTPSLTYKQFTSPNSNPK